MRPLLLLLGIAAATPAFADDVWLGVYRHDIVIHQTKYEGGTDLRVGWIGRPIEALAVLGRPSPHALVSWHPNGTNDFAAVGLDWTFGSRFYARPGIGIAVNDGPRPAYRGSERVDLGSPVTFEPELALGWRIAPRFRIEASYIHLSHLWLFSHQNRGLDTLGVRTLLRLR